MEVNANGNPMLLEVVKEREVWFHAISLETKEEAQNALTPVTTYALFYNGELKLEEETASCFV